MNVLDIFDGTKEFREVNLPPLSSRKSIKPDSSFFDDTNNWKKLKKSGVDYAHKYVNEEEKNYLKASTDFIRRQHEKMDIDEISESTVPPLMINTLQHEETMRIYHTYNFEYRPKTNLIISSLRNDIVRTVESNPVTIIRGPTGCGKTTQVPQYILDYCYERRIPCNIIVTQPRRIAAISLAKRVSEERDWPVGTLVGYKIGMLDNTSHDTRLTYCTVGVLLNKLIHMKHMLDFTHIILDEVHERDQEMDFLLLIVRKFLRTNSHLVKVILMSATINVDKFATYYSSPALNMLVPAPVIDIPNRRVFDVKIFYLNQITNLGPIPEVCAENPQITKKMIEFCTSIIIILDDVDKSSADNELLKEEFRRHVVLVFLPGIYEIDEVYTFMTAPSYNDRKWEIIVLHSSITNEEQQQIFATPGPNIRRIILATNIAESSITVPGVKYVIDFCMTKQLVTDPNTNFQCLQLTWTSKSNCQQRAGRAGRIMDGRVFRMVPYTFYENVLPEEMSPEIKRVSLNNVVLKAKALDMGDPKSILALSIDPPDIQNLEMTILLLKEIGALVDTPNRNEVYDGVLTDLGRVMNELPLDVYLTKFIMLGHLFGVLRETIIMSVNMSSKSVFSNRFGQKLESYDAKLTWSENSDSDAIAFLNAYKVWMFEKANGRFKSASDEKQWAVSNFLQIKVLREVNAMISEITNRLSKIGIQESHGIDRIQWTNVERHLVLSIVIAGAFYPNYFQLKIKDEEIQEVEIKKTLNNLDPSKTVYLTGWPDNQPKYLYIKAIQQTFYKYLNLSAEDDIDIKIHFISSRICVQFESKSNKNDDNTRKQIAYLIRKAVKLRLLRIPIEIKVLEVKEAVKELSMLKVPTEKSHFFSKKKSDDNGSNDELENKKRSLDENLNLSLPLDVLNIDNPSHIWVRFKDDETKNYEMSLFHQSKNISMSLRKCLKKPSVGTLVLVSVMQNGEEVQCRGMIQGDSKTNNENMVSVFFIDFGYTSEISFSELKIITPNTTLAKIPTLAVECNLLHVKPFKNSGTFTEESVQTFKNFIKSSKNLYGKIHSTDSKILTINLISESNQERFSINKYLIDWGLTAPIQECITDSESEISTEFSNYPEPPNPERCASSVKLSGPFSPLEVEYRHLVKNSCSKHVIVDVSSVNSVILHTESEKYRSQLLVASSISQSFMNNKLRLRNTTLLPNVQGLAALIALTFAPKIELRRDITGTRYIGALCGMGFDPLTKNSIYPDHDMEIDFDVEITINDLQEINKLRLWMNTGMYLEERSGETFDLQEIKDYQKKIKDAVTNIFIVKKRKEQKIEASPFGSKWGLYDESLFLVVEKHFRTVNNIYELHRALELKMQDEEISHLINHCVELNSLVKEELPQNDTEPIECKLCNVTLEGKRNLAVHLCSKLHSVRQNYLFENNA